LIILFLFRFKSRFLFALGSTSSGSELLFPLGYACIFAFFGGELDAAGVTLGFFRFFDAGAGDGAGSVASLFASRAYGFYVGSNK
jgi:hypothetical protein